MHTEQFRLHLWCFQQDSGSHLVACRNFVSVWLCAGLRFSQQLNTARMQHQLCKVRRNPSSSIWPSQSALRSLPLAFCHASTTWALTFHGTNCDLPHICPCVVPVHTWVWLRPAPCEAPGGVSTGLMPSEVEAGYVLKCTPLIQFGFWMLWCLWKDPCKQPVNGNLGRWTFRAEIPFDPLSLQPELTWRK